MGRFCSNCGSELTGKFCSNCGAAAESAVVDAAENRSDSYIMQLNGVDVNAVELLHRFGRRNSGEANQYLRETTGASMKEAMLFTVRVFNDKAVLAEVEERLKAEEKAFQEETERLKKEKIPYCPKCHSTHLSANEKGFSLGKATAGWVLAGPAVGILGGMLGRKRIKLTCLNCGHKFDIQEK